LKRGNGGRSSIRLCQTLCTIRVPIH
jgi:hypothetical protein